MPAKTVVWLKQMRNLLVIFMLFASVAGGTLAWADDVTDAILGVDPRLKLQSGRGSSFGSVYGPQQEEAVSPEEPNAPLEESEAVNRYAPYEGGLRSPLFDVSGGSENAEDDSRLPQERLSLPQTPPLGKPDARDGVWYSDDLNK